MGSSVGTSAGNLQHLQDAGGFASTSIQGAAENDAAEERRRSQPANLFHCIEQLATLEATLWSILEGMKSNATYVAFFCREYWGSSASRAQLSLEKFAWHDRLKRQVQLACVLESLSLAVTSHLCSGTMQEVSVTIRSRLRNLLYYVHENCLVLLDLVSQRWQQESQGTRWPEGEKTGHCPENLNFEILVRVKRYRQLRKGEHAMALRQHNEMIVNVVRQLCRGATSKQPPPPRARGAGDGQRSPGAGGGRVTRNSNATQGSILAAVCEILSASMPLDRLRARTIRNNMLAHMRFQPLLNVDGVDADCPWPEQDPYERFGADQFAVDGPIIWFEPLPPMMTDLERTPKLPPAKSDDTYTLVLDLDETLVHYYELDGMGNYGVRPGMYEFLQRMNARGYELVIFTAATQDYADWVIDQIDPERLVHHRLYRQHALPWGPLFTKDLSRLGRDLDRTLIIDNVQENFMLQPNHGIFIYTWYDDPEDQALFQLAPLLDELIATRARVPDILSKYQDQIPAWAGFGQFSQLADACLDFEPDLEDSLPEPPVAPTPPPLGPPGGGLPQPQPVAKHPPQPSHLHMAAGVAGSYAMTQPSYMAGTTGLRTAEPLRSPGARPLGAAQADDGGMYAGAPAQGTVHAQLTSLAPPMPGTIYSSPLEHAQQQPHQAMMQGTRPMQAAGPPMPPRAAWQPQQGDQSRPKAAPPQFATSGVAGPLQAPRPAFSTGVSGPYQQVLRH